MHSSHRQFLGFFPMILVLLAFPGSTGTAEAAIRVPTHVACVGDSITQGVGASSSSTNYPADLQGLFGNGVRVMNFGHSGATMLSVGDLPYQNQPEYTAATSFVSNAGSTATIDVIIMLGTNDSKPYNWMVDGGTRTEQFRSDCAAMVDHFAQLPTHPLVYLALPPRAFQNTYDISGTVIHDEIFPIIRQVATAKNIAVIDVDTPTAGHPELFTDGVHPNDAGYRLVAQVMHDGLLASISGAGGSGGGGGTAGSGVGGTAGEGAGGSGGAAGVGGTVGGAVGGLAGEGGSGSGGAGGVGGTVGMSGAAGRSTAGAAGGEAGATGGRAAAGNGGATSPTGAAGTGDAMGSAGVGGSGSPTGGSSSGCACDVVSAGPMMITLPCLVTLVCVLRRRRRRYH